MSEFLEFIFREHAAELGMALAIAAPFISIGIGHLL